MNFIDAHAHVWTDDTAHYPLGDGWRRDDMRPRRFTADELLKHMRDNGVNRCNLIQMSFYYPRDLSSGKGLGFNNSYMLDMVDLHKDLFVGTAVIDPLAKAPEREMEALAKRRVRAFRITPARGRQPIERWLQPEGFGRMFTAGARLNLAISCLIDPAALPELDRMCTKFADTPVIIDHLCRIGGDAKGEIRDADVKALCAMARHKRVMVKVGAFYALGKKAPPYTDLAPLVQSVVTAFGARRCMWESDCPFQVQEKHTYRDSIDMVRTRLKFLGDADREWLLRRTAEEFFFRR